MDDSNENVSTILGSAIVGLIAGFAVAVLTAPKSGEDLRNSFWDKITEVEASLDEDLKDRGLL